MSLIMRSWYYKIACNDKQRWNKDKCRCKCKQMIDKSRCHDGFMNVINHYANFKRRKRKIDKLFEECSEDINQNPNDL